LNTQADDLAVEDRVLGFDECRLSCFPLRRRLSSYSAWGTLNAFNVASACLRKIVQSLSLMLIPLWESFMSRPLGRFWQHRGEDGMKRERQLLVDFLCACTGGPMYYQLRVFLQAVHQIVADCGDGVITAEAFVERFLAHGLVSSGSSGSTKKWHPHLLRHACGTHMHDHDAPLQAVASLLGHARLSTAQIYTRVSVGRMMKTYNAAHPHARLSWRSVMNANAQHVE
jgi:hypothetical protein